MVDTVRQSTVVRLPHARSPLDITEAKLLRPPRRLGTVNRPALVDRLIDSRTIPLIAIVAPAGYGKTTLLSDWAERDQRPFAWVSVDEGDVDPVVFLSHVAMALDRIEQLDADVFRAIASPGAANPGRAVRRLGAAISRRTRPFVLVLDELDRAHEPLCLDAVASLTPYLPEGSAIAITSRTVPKVGLPRFRADGRLLEIGVDDLALDPSPPDASSGAPASSPPRPRLRSSPTRPRVGRSASTWRRCPTSNSNDPGWCHRSGSPARTGSSSTTSARRS